MGLHDTIISAFINETVGRRVGQDDQPVTTITAGRLINDSYHIIENAAAFGTYMYSSSQSLLFE